MRNYVISSLYPIQILVIQLRFTQRFINVLLAKLNTMNYEFAWLLRIAKEQCNCQIRYDLAETVL